MPIDLSQVQLPELSYELSLDKRSILYITVSLFLAGLLLIIINAIAQRMVANAIAGNPKKLE